MSDRVTVLITGAAGQIAYSLIPLIGNGLTFGPHTMVDLVLFDIPVCETVLGGVNMEITDSLYKYIHSVKVTVDPEVAFTAIDYAFMLGAAPRKAGMDRADLLSKNSSIFVEQGKYLEKFAKKTVKVLIVGNPANTNCYVMMKNAPSIPKENFSAMTRLDHNRLIGQISNKASVNFATVHHAVIWGNHSGTQYPDSRNIQIEKDGRMVPISEIITDSNYLKNELITTVAKRGEAIINARKLSSAMSAAKAASDQMHDWVLGTKEGEWVSMAVYSNGEYDIAKDIYFSFPVTCKDGKYTIVQGIEIDESSRARMQSTQDELLHEKKVALSG